MLSDQPVGEWPDVSMPVAVRRLDARDAALAEILALTRRKDGTPRNLLRRADVLAIFEKHGVGGANA